MGEHLLCKQGVVGSSPITSTSLSAEASAKAGLRPAGFGWQATSKAVVFLSSVL